MGTTSAQKKLFFNLRKAKGRIGALEDGDLRPENVALWLSRFQKMIKARAILRDMGSASASITRSLGNTFEIGEVVAWIFNNEMTGYRVK